MLIKGPEDFAAAFGVSRGTLDKLVIYQELLTLWQGKINLVAPSTLGEIWGRHFADSAQLAALAPPGAQTWVDLGSGGGFPGLVLAILRLDAAAEPGSAFLVESDQRKAAFLGEVARKTGAIVEIVRDRIENVATQDKFGPVDVVTARAFAPLPRLIGLAAPMLRSGAVGLFPKGKDAELEIAAARAEWDFDSRLVASRVPGGGQVVVIENLRGKAEG